MDVTKTIFILRYEADNFMGKTKWFIVRKFFLYFDKYRLWIVFNVKFPKKMYKSKKIHQ